MIDRYTLPEMGRVWSDQHKYELWCRVETLVLEAHAAAGRVPADVVEPVRNAPPPTPERVAEIEETTQHDVIAFLTAWADNTEPRSAAAYVHHGMTSSDLLDTALAVQLTDATDVLLAKADRSSPRCATTGWRTATRSRSAAPTACTPSPTCGGTGSPTSPSPRRAPATGCGRPATRVGVVAISGAVGTYSLIDPSVEVAVAEALGLRPADASTQVVLRDSISEWVVGAGDHRDGLRGGRARGAARPAHRGAGAVGGVRLGPEGLQRDAAQEEPDPLRAHRRARAGGARRRRPGDGGHPAVARAGHLALLHRAGLPARRGDHHRLPAAPDDRAGGEPRRRRPADARQPRPDRRADLHVVGAAGGRRGRPLPRGRLRAGAGRGDGDLEHRDAVPRDAAVARRHGRR